MYLYRVETTSIGNGNKVCIYVVAKDLKDVVWEYGNDVLNIELISNDVKELDKHKYKPCEMCGGITY